MQIKVGKRKIFRTTGNVLFFAALALLVINPGAKGWVLKQLVRTGVFNAEIRKDAPVLQVPADFLSFVYRDEQGNTTSTRSFKGRVVFINFWATWCPPCVAEMTSLNQLYQQMRADNRVVFLFINQDEDAARAKQFLLKNGYDIPLFKAPGTIPASLYSGTLPTTIVLDKEGAMVLKHEGLANYNNAKFLAQLKRLL